jgi:dTDP-4-dehydrorhamnose 3,5-epimerase
MQVETTPLPGVLRLMPKVFGDARGFFTESWNARTMADAGLDLAFVQDNHSRSARGVLRGLHYQLSHPQGKLVRVARGAVFDVAVDLRRSSPHFGRWWGTELSDENMAMLWIPPGFGHGFLTLSDTADFLYKCTTAYDPASDRSLAWNDPDIGIVWPDAGTAPQLSAKDAAAPALSVAEVFS